MNQTELKASVDVADNSDVPPVDKRDLESIRAIGEYLFRHCKSLLSKEPQPVDGWIGWRLDEDHPEFMQDRQFIKNTFVDHWVVTQGRKVDKLRDTEPHQAAAIKAFIDETQAIVKSLERMANRGLDNHHSLDEERGRLSERIEDAHDSLAEVFRLPIDGNVEFRKWRRDLRRTESEFFDHPYHRNPKEKGKYGAMSDGSKMYIGESESEAMNNLRRQEPHLKAPYFVGKLGEKE